KTKVTAEGISYQGEDDDPQDLERVINVPARNKAIVEEFKAEEDKRDPKRERKTIVFAVTKKHAAQLTRFFNQVYNDPTETYAQVITTDTPDPTALIKKFKRQDRPVIAVSVGMLDTGFDAPVVENLVMVRPTKSAILYQQMRGRGARLSTKIGKTSFRIYDFAGNSEHFNDESYNPYEQPQVRFRRGPAVAEPAEEKEESFKQELLKRREIVQVTEGGPEDIDKIVERAVIEVGPEGEKVDVRDYKTEWEEDIKKWVQKADPLILKVKNNEALAEEEMRGLSEKLNSPEFYFNEANLRLAYDQPDGTLSEFIKVALGQYEFPTKEERVGKAFDAWIIQNNFEPAQVSLLRMIKNQYVAGAQIDVGIFNKPPFSQQGGLDRALKIFGAEKLKETLGQLSSQVLR
ncbi:MAG TPA: type I restriction-modification enzyme R subunit C-terminal domain-containing protein, partial [Candidatus Nanoarchaeia archaeon]